MGRKKITIKPITDERNRHVTFNKRKSGLIKKAMELSILCNCQISLVIFNAENQLFEYCSTDPRFILQRYCQVAHLPHERLANADYQRFDKATGKKRKNSLSQMTVAEENSSEEYNDMANSQEPQMQLPFQGDYGGYEQQRFQLAPGQVSIVNPNMRYNEGMVPFTPLTPNTIAEIVQQNDTNEEESPHKRRKLNNLTIQVPQTNQVPVQKEFQAPQDYPTRAYQEYQQSASQVASDVQQPRPEEYQKTMLTGNSSDHPTVLSDRDTTLTPLSQFAQYDKSPSSANFGTDWKKEIL